MPTLVIWGDADTVVPPSDARRFVEDIRDSRPARGAVVRTEISHERTARLFAELGMRPVAVPDPFRT